MKFSFFIVPCLFLLLFSPLFSANAQIVTINGTAVGYEGKQVSLIGYSNYITYNERVLSVDTISLTSKFHLEVSCNKTSFVSVRLEGVDYQMLIVPGSEYDIQNYEISSLKPNLKISAVNDGDMYVKKLDFDIEYDEIIISYLPLRREIPPKLDSSLLDLEKRHYQEGYSYLNNYIKYSIALVQQMTYRKRMTQFNEKYIIDQPLLEYNHLYVKFIDQYFSNYLIILSMGPDAGMVMKCVNKSSNIENLMSIMHKDQRLFNDTLKEFVLIKGLFEAYHHPISDFKKDKILILLKKIGAFTKYVKHKELVDDVIFSLTYLKAGYNAPEFELYNHEGNLIKLSDFQGKMIYLNFWSSGSVNSIKENKLIPKLVETFIDDVVFVNISLDKDDKAKKDCVKFMKDGVSTPNQYFLHFGKQKSINQSYQIKTLPSYFIVGKDGKFLRSPAKRPSEGVSQVLAKLLDAKSNRSGLDGP